MAGHILDLITREQLSNHLDSTAAVLGMSVRFVDSTGRITLDSSPVGSACIPPKIWTKFNRAIKGGSSELYLEGYFLCATPLNLKGRPYGLLCAYQKGDCKQNGMARHLLALSASQLESLMLAGIEVTSLTGEVVRVYEELAVINSLTSKLVAKINVEDVCHIIAEEVWNILNPTDVIIHLVEEKTLLFRPVLALGVNKDLAMGFAPRLEEGPIGQAYITKRSIMTSAVEGASTWPFKIKKLFVIPLIAEGQVIGMISATDKADGADFNSHEEKLVSVISSVASISIKNSQSYAKVQNLLDGFITASVTAVESRDPCTAGHSHRVAALAFELAKRVRESVLPQFEAVTFTDEELREIYYAGLLHDFGKIGVSEPVLLKKEKLYPYELERIRTRLSFIKEQKRCTALEKKLKILQDEGTEVFLAQSAKIDKVLADDVNNIEKVMGLIEAANDPKERYLKTGSRKLLPGTQELDILDKAAAYIGPSGRMLSYLAPAEIINLHIVRGSLNQDERREVESHVTHSYNFLTKIPWTGSFMRIAEIVYSHHERLDGSGYPRGLKNNEILIQAMILAIADIFDAITAHDRPDRKPASVSRALSILDAESSNGKLNPHLVKLFRDKRVYKAAAQPPPVFKIT